MANLLTSDGKSMFYKGFISTPTSFQIRLRGTNYNEYKTATFITADVGGLNSINLQSTLVFDCPQGANVSYIEITALAEWISGSAGQKAVMRIDLEESKTFANQSRYYLTDVDITIGEEVV